MTNRWRIVMAANANQNTSDKEHTDEDDPISTRSVVATTYLQSNPIASDDPGIVEWLKQNRETQYQLEKSIHHMCNLSFDNRLYLAPIREPERVLDVASGCGIWATEIAKKHNTAEVAAFDLLPLPSGTRPKNFKSKTLDCRETWTYPKDHFNLIHIRGLFGSLQDWPDLYRKAFSHLQSGGYIEQVEWSMHIRSLDGKLSSNSVFNEWSRNVVKAGILSGKTFEIAENMAGLVQEAGFVDVVERRFKWPVGAWSQDPKMKEIGRCNLVNWEQALRKWAHSSSAGGPSLSQAEIDEWVAESIQALRNPGHDIFHEMRVVYARKP